MVIGHKADGSSVFKYTYANTQKEITDKLRDMAAAYQGADLTEEMRITFSEWLDSWCRDYLSLSVRESTVKSYQREIRNHILPYLGDKAVAAITPADIQKLYNHLRTDGRVKLRDKHGTGLAETSIYRVHNLLHQAMDAAVRERLIPSNPVDGVTTPKKHYKPKQILNDEQLDWTRSRATRSGATSSTRS